MEIEQDVSRTVGAVEELGAHLRYQPRAALGSAWERTVASASFAVIQSWLGEDSQAAQGAGSGDPR